MVNRPYRSANLFLLVSTVLLLAACADTGGPISTPVAWRCTERLVFDAIADDTLARLEIPGNAMKLPRTESASGARYASGDTEFWIKGNRASLQLEGHDYECELDEVIEMVRDAGVDFRGIGQEPGWILDISDGERFVLRYNFGQDKVELPWAEAEVLSDSTRIHFVEDSTGALKIVIEPGLCEDSLSGQRFNYRVKVAWQELDLRGCGRDL